MNHNEYIYWLDGYLADKGELTPAETYAIKEKLNTFFNKVTPNLPCTHQYFDHRSDLSGFRPFTGEIYFSGNTISC